MNNKKKRISVLEEEVQTRIKEINENEDCDEVELGSICKIYSGKPIKKENRIGTLYPYCSANGIDGYVNEYLFDGTYILCAQDGSIGATHLMKGKIYPSNHVWLLDIKNISILYIYRILKHFTNYDNYKTGSVIPKITKDKLEKIKIPIPKDKTLITALESKFQEIEKLQDEVKQAETLYKQYLDELSTAAIKKPSTLDTTSTQDTPPAAPITPDTTSIEPIKPKKTKVAITKKKTPKAQQPVDTSLDAILGAASS
jgi:type I restriction enzyme S subunit